MQKRGEVGTKKEGKKKLVIGRFFVIFGCQESGYKRRKKADKNPKHVPPAGRKRTGMRSTLSSNG